MRRRSYRADDNISGDDENRRYQLKYPVKVLLRLVRVEVRPRVRRVENHYRLRHQQLVANRGQENVPREGVATFSDQVERQKACNRPIHDVIKDVQIALNFIPSRVLLGDLRHSWRFSGTGKIFFLK